MCDNDFDWPTGGWRRTMMQRGDRRMSVRRFIVLTIVISIALWITVIWTISKIADAVA